MNESFKKKLTRGDLLLGTIVTLPSVEIIEILCSRGFDWLFIDLEHSALSIREAQTILQVSGLKTDCAVRIPLNNEVWMKKCLDIGASGIIVPQIRNKEDAELAVQLCKYPPQGARSVGIARAQGYGNRFHEYVTEANDSIALVLQIEHIEAVNNIDEILNVPGIDCLFIGPYDLSASMDKIGRVTDPEVQDAISRVKKGAEQANIQLGIFGADAEAVLPYIESGYKLIAAGMDTMILGSAAGNLLKTLRG